MVLVTERNGMWRTVDTRRDTYKGSRFIIANVCMAFFVCWGCAASRPPVQRGKDRESGDVKADWIEPRDGEEPSEDMSEGGEKVSEARPPKCPSESVVSIAPVIWDDNAGHLRWWIGERLLDEVKSSKEKPVEVCGVRGQLQWLMNSVCPDGKKPFSSFMEAHQSRSGSIGAGGRCGKIVDLYRVPCETKVYEVYMSLYHCTSSERTRGEGPPGSDRTK